MYGEFQKLDTIILGISPDNETSHQKFIEQYDIPFPLLCDPGKKVMAKYEAFDNPPFSFIDPPAHRAREHDLAHLAAQRRLVSDRARQPAEQRRNLGPGLDVAKDIVHKKEHLALFTIPKVFGHGQRREGSPKTRAGGLVHLSKDQHRVLQHARALHLQVELVPLERALTHTGKDRDALVLS